MAGDGSKIMYIEIGNKDLSLCRKDQSLPVVIFAASTPWNNNPTNEISQ